MGFEVGNVVVVKGSDLPMTILRFVGDDENDAMNLMDNQLRAQGYEAGSPMCQWFEGSELKSSTFQASKLEVQETDELEVATDEEKPAEKKDDDFDFDDEDFNF